MSKNNIYHFLVRLSLTIFPVILVFACIDQWRFLYETYDRGQVIGRDAYNLWTAGRILIQTGSAQSIYNNELFTLFQINNLDQGIGWNSYFYPPTAFLTASLMGLTYYSAALFIYTLIGIAAFTIAVSTKDNITLAFIFTIAAPMTIFNIIMGQNGLISATLLIGGLRLLNIRPIFAGILFGLLGFKPILGLLIPILLIIRKDWTVFISATITLIITATLPIILWGADVWWLFLSEAIEIQKNTLHHATGIGMLMITSAFNSARIFGFDTLSSYVSQLIVTAIALFFFIYHFTKKKNKSRLTPHDILFFTLSTSLISPYIHNYDLSILEGSIIFYCLSSKELTPKISMKVFFTICWCTGIMAVALNSLSIPIVPALLVIALYFMRRTEKQKI
ncbi:glycosyltransferase family 87 protein [Paraperlucidibaca baekdonensis]|uniref:glycosyltransferase family 87 protein n=1 Tax=Paraperlucidibaca baekdonensis TaxID=748120 RepID=UPI0015F2932D|nr:glycosyltransferase family 87 protein [Paraperlucidibaca baekdonensis]